MPPLNKQHPGTSNLDHLTNGFHSSESKYISNMSLSVSENPNAALYYAIFKEMKYDSFTWFVLEDI